MPRGGLLDERRDVLPQVLPRDEEERVDEDLLGAVPRARGDRLVDRRGGEIHVGDVDGDSTSEAPHLGRHALQVLVGLRAPAPVVDDHEGALHPSAGPQ